MRYRNYVEQTTFIVLIPVLFSGLKFHSYLIVSFLIFSLFFFFYIKERERGSVRLSVVHVYFFVCLKYHFV